MIGRCRCRCRFARREGVVGLESLDEVFRGYIAYYIIAPCDISIVNQSIQSSKRCSLEVVIRNADWRTGGRGRE
jgi:hypothetical protein